jgi:hypothetical protein
MKVAAFLQLVSRDARRTAGVRYTQSPTRQGHRDDAWHALDRAGDDFRIAKRDQQPVVKDLGRRLVRIGIVPRR